MTPVQTTSAELSRRRDARRNRTLIIEAAREVFATGGFAAPLDAVARRAGVGRGTLYRHFADRYALAVAIFEDNVRDIERLAEEYDGRADAFDALLRAVVDHQVRSHGLFQAVSKGAEAPDLQALADRIVRVFAGPIRRAQEDGAVRVDLQPTDILDVMRMVAAVIEGEDDLARRRSAATRALDLLHHGLRG
ncbi:TetR/AcrR family transcriptional regulator [Phytohabitans rumicis]|uniref:TetR family transcriptional regulator n=1 Tax=Phytohabitans rumicis TaxID=1076125 RepID=A0A6V8LBN5_9ACTN|nr:TetR/AcrR family transcriptional regulator [Phytohabitans rumicis]GFJ93040.1 TetR family transcriptional regulator [Phytohabitans rumicis]